ncbi:septal ring lytic transglycosylase RlpA family protein [Phenylobacterium montanum]|uniref:Endolytic peptidoglycan transglycosylase RlpA n=1 Tax=Phenylobacterium montanum TaxID=2823693 RepID=A0A975IX04_9CAUL|nr:septal ring lytic transglycosylase RlpA family protein [Caulobacter sp. S6]QUD88906.1 septal ring lytic transglycosylase RlpA family protein [Caulobacter sp. S6]
MATVWRVRDGGSARLARVSLVLGLGGLGLAACATAPERPGLGVTPGPQASARPPAGQGSQGQGGQGPGGFGGQGLHGTDKPYQINGIWYYPHAEPNYDETGYASWYGQAFHNKHTADGEIFDQYALSAAHKTLPLPSIVEVTNLDNGKSLRLRLNDRGPFVGERLLDVSKAAADELGFGRQGLARVRVRYVGPAPAFSITPMMYASTDPKLISDHRVAYRSSDKDADDALPTVAKAPTGKVQAQSLTPVGAPPAAPPPEMAAMTNNSRERFAEPSVSLSGAALAPVTAAAQAPGLVAVSAPPPQPVEMASLTPPPAPRVVSPAPVPPPSPLARDGYVVQAGAFASRANADRAAAQLGSGVAIRPIDRNGVTLYRVVMTGYADAASAEAARARAAAAGFPAARIIASN